MKRDSFNIQEPRYIFLLERGMSKLGGELELRPRPTDWLKTTLTFVSQMQTLQANLMEILTQNILQLYPHVSGVRQDNSRKYPKRTSWTNGR